MSNNTPYNKENEEIDLAQVREKMSGLVQRGKDLVFDAIQFAIRNIVIILVLFFVGLGLGFYLDRTQKVYDNQLVVTPNFYTADYLYSRIALLNAKLKEGDTMYLKKLGFKNPTKIKFIEVKPVVDVYRFVTSNSERNFDMLKLLAEDNDIKKIIEENATSKNYTYHEILFTTKDRTSNDKFVTPLMNFLNNSPFHEKVRKVEVENMKIRMKENDLILSQINNFLNGVGTGEGKGEKLVYYNENSPLSELIRTKEELIRTQGYLRVNMVSADKIVKEVSQTLNMENRQATNGRMKLVLPLLLVFLFVFITLFRDFYRAQSQKRQNAA